MQYAISKSVTRVGRDAGNDIALPNDDQASRYHAEIRQEGGMCVLYDLGSTNGTFVNGQRVARHVLTNGDRIRIGNSRLTFQNGALLLSGGAVVSSQRPAAPRGPAWVPPPPQPASSSTPIVIAAVVGVLGVAIVLGAIVLLFVFPDRGGPEQIARNWVNSNLGLITTEVTARALGRLPLEPLVLRDMVHERLSASSAWVYTTREKVAEGIYRVEARATFGIALTTPPANYNITAVYVVTVDTTGGIVKEYSLTSVTVSP